MDSSTSKGDTDSHPDNSETTPTDSQSAEVVTGAEPADNDETVSRGFWSEPAEPIEKTFDALESSKKDR